MPAHNENYGKGYFLIANPVLPDPNFSRTVILLCNHDDQGSFGLVINRPAPITAKEIFEEINVLNSPTGKIFIGGPVSPSQVFYLCRSNEPLPELELICDGIYMGLSWELLDNLMMRIENPDLNIRFYMGYSGWGAGQLAGEMTRLSWLTCEAKSKFVFQENEDGIWANAVKFMGKDYEYLIKAPVNPQWN
ncbi:MAG: YqgE/AlgH family protein [Nitrospinaceae bacterium]